MCGIAGLFTKYEDLSENIKMLSDMSKTLTRRGPDENGIFIDHNVALIHRRLVVIDKENGKQPMVCGKKGEKYVIVYNGELYNTEELRTELTKKGYEFKGHSDTEVVFKKCISNTERNAPIN